MTGISSATGYAPKIVEVIFSDEGPRDGWKEQCYDGKTTMSKCLAAGRFGLIRYHREINLFLKALGLPEAFFISQEEFMGATKTYFVLRVEKTEWTQKILPIKNSYNEKVNELTELAIQVFNDNVVIPK